MSAPVRTGIYVGVAAVLALVAMITAPSLGPGSGFEDEGEVFFPEFTAPGQALSLEVYEVDEESATASVFKVERKDDVWIIPSEYDYPADAKERMADAASLLIGLTKGAVRSDSRAEHAALGVVDPREQEGDLEGRGLLVAFKGEGDLLLGELIIGKKVEGREDQRFVRIPDKRRTYNAKIPSDLSTAFADWVETDLLKLSSWDIESLVFDNYSVDERAGMVRPGEKVVATKEDGSWTVTGLADEEEVETEKLDDAGRSLDDLKIVGVRPKPDGLTKRLGTAQGYDRAVLLRSLQGRGFFLGRDKLYSNEGDLLVTTKEGVLYTLKFGEIVYGSGEGSDGEDGEKKDARPNRYLMVTVEVAPGRLEKPEGEEIASEEIVKRKEAMREIRVIIEKIDAIEKEKEALPETLAEAIGDETDLEKDPWDHPYAYEKLEEGYRVTSPGLDGEVGGEGANADITSDSPDAEDARLKAAETIRKWKDDLESAKESVDDLEKRFGPWYYVIDAALFDKLKLSRADVVKAKEKEEEEEEGADDEAPPSDEEPRDEGDDPEAGDPEPDDEKGAPDPGDSGTDEDK